MSHHEKRRKEHEREHAAHRKAHKETGKHGAKEGHEHYGQMEAEGGEIPLKLK